MKDEVIALNCGRDATNVPYVSDDEFHPLVHDLVAQSVLLLFVAAEHGNLLNVCVVEKMKEHLPSK